jgi:arylsulfatase A-like enzyme
MVKVAFHYNFIKHLYMKTILLFLITFGLTSGANAQSKKDNLKEANKKYNVIFFLVDDMGWSDLGYEGSSLYETPTIDSFAKKGVRFTQAYAACHVCSPTRASIMTGEYPARLHLTDWLPGRKDFPFQKLESRKLTVQHLPYNQPTLPRVLKDNGYKTAIFGKWHLGWDDTTYANSPQRQGFDIHIPDWDAGWPNGTYFSPYGLKGLEGGPKGQYLTDRLTDEAMKWVAKNKDHPFFLYLANFAVHDPIQGRGDLVVKYEKKLNQMRSKEESGDMKGNVSSTNLFNPNAGNAFTLEGNPDDPNPLSRQALDALSKDKEYSGFSLLPNRIVKVRQQQTNPVFAAMVESVDESLATVLQKLKELGLEDNTIIIFFSDNGGMSAANFGNPHRNISPFNLDKAYSTSNLPLRGGKGWLYEGGIREPLIIYIPNSATNGTVVNTPVISTDFYSTIMDILGLPLTNGKDGVDGMSLVPILKNQEEGKEKIAKRAIYWHFPHYSNHGAQSPGGAVRYGDYKLLEYYENGTVQLFNIKDDPGEHNDLSKTEPKKAEELKEMLHKWRKSVDAVMPYPNPKYDPKAKWPTPSVSADEP